MAAFFRCDRCRQEYKERENVQAIPLPKVAYNGRHFELFGEDAEIRYDVVELCAPCMKMLVDLAKPLSAHAVEESR